MQIPPPIIMVGHVYPPLSPSQTVPIRTTVPIKLCFAFVRDRVLGPEFAVVTMVTLVALPFALKYLGWSAYRQREGGCGS